MKLSCSNRHVNYSKYYGNFLKSNSHLISVDLLNIACEYLPQSKYLIKIILECSDVKLNYKCFDYVEENPDNLKILLNFID